MIRIFLGNQLLVLFLLPLVIGGYIMLNSGMLSSETIFFEISQEVDLGLWGSFTLGNPNKSGFNWLQFIPGVFVFLNALLLNFLFNINTFYDKNTYVVSLLYTVLMSFYHSFYQIDGVLIAHSFLILSLFQLFELENNLDGRKIAFNAGFLYGCAASFHPPLIFGFPMIWFMLTRIRPFVFRETFLSTIGFITPLIYGFMMILWNKNQINWNFIETSVNYTQKQFLFLISMALFAFSALLSLWGIRIKNAKSSIRFRKLTAIIFLLLFIGVGLGTVEILFLKQYEWFSFGMIALVLFLPFSFFYKATQMFATILFYTTFLFSIAKFFIK